MTDVSRVKHVLCVVMTHLSAQLKELFIVYRGYCVDCQMEITGDSGYIPCVDILTYISETRRPAQERISEHVKNVQKWNKDSMILHQWMECHGTETVIPTF